MNETNSITVSFETNGAGTIEPIVMPKNGIVTTPNISKDGYKFEGWYTDKELIYKFTNTASNDLTLYAKWSKAYRIRFINYDGTIISDEMVEEGNPILYGKENPIRKDDEIAKYNFIGWDKELGNSTSDTDFVAQYETIEFGFRYELSSTNDYYIVTDYIEKTNEEEIVVPEEYNNLPIKEIATGAFKKLHIKKITIGPNIKKINMSAIDECYNLETLVLPFAGDKEYKENEDYPYPFKYIFGTTEFENSHYAASINSDYANRYFYENDIDIIVRYANLSSVDFYMPNTLTNVIITTSKYIPYNAFGNANFKSIVLPEDCEIEAYAFAMCDNLESINIPSDAKSIKEATFERCYSLKKIDLPDSLKEISKMAFVSCWSLESIKIPNGVTTLGIQAFTACCALATIEIPNSVITIGNSCFFGCELLTEILLPNDITAIEDETFHNCTSLVNINIPAKVTSIGRGAFDSCTSLLSIDIPSNITKIGNGAFYNCRGLERITISENVTEINPNMFHSCSKLNEVIIKGNITSIGFNAFANCSSLKSIVLSNTIEEIGERAFYGLSNLTVYYKGDKENTDIKDAILAATNKDMTLIWYCYTTNGASEARKGNWWYYNSNNQIVEVINN